MGCRSMRTTKFAAIALSVLLLTGCKTELYTGLTEREANEIISILMLNRVSADREFSKSGDVTVRVEESQFSAAVEILKAEGYPKQHYSNLGEVFQGNGFVVSQTEERARFIFAMSEELSRTISEIDGILSARTHVVLPANDPLSRNTTPSSASVVIRHAATAPAESLLPQIKMMVANSIEGLEYSNVSVVFIPVKKRETAMATPGAISPLPTQMSALPPLWLLATLGLALTAISFVAGTVFLRNRNSTTAKRKSAFVVENAE